MLWAVCALGSARHAGTEDWDCLARQAGEQARGPGSEDVSGHGGEGACESSLRNGFRV